MTEETAIDRAHAAMEAAPEDDAARLRFWERVADAELNLLLEREIEADSVEPRLFEIEGVSYALAFDRADRLTGFTGQASAYAELSGRALAQMMAGQGIGLGLNIEVAPSAMLIPPDAVEWLAATLGEGPAEAEGRIEEVRAPAALPEVLLGALDQKLATAAGLARTAWLAQVGYAGGGQGTLLAFVDAAPGAERALAGAVREALVFSGVEAGALDVAFFAGEDPVAAAIARHGVRIDLPELQRSERRAPGSDPVRPPKLR
ncbi:SseB family protein [Histidinibacterium aquaticum]|uniref:SseB family protein n=1 Tax=Histidinibacterium aquaticum TaxID=2613962 RepID=A0A5J5GQF0_9RHOB|nr:SseB family protein [Histidinibacterium aquaticum]KAA9010410.1 SseB family protein [Histidinibacterium aquaticum]